MRIPSRNHCYRLMREMGMLEHIAAHSLMVCMVSLKLAEGIIGRGVPLSRALIRAGAILHDITKTRSFKTGEHHGDTGGVLLEELGFPEVGDIIRQHVRLEGVSSPDIITEAEIVHYADKRVLHDHVVGLDERMRYIIGRYARTEEHVRILTGIWNQTRTLEEKIFHHQAFGPEELASRISREEFAAEREILMEIFHGE
ncbi:MAG: metal-dependent phosphohydrolase [Desulfobacterales bacterium]|nr:MAG: metal-dependent phosphohydrolase [Desulfobacterales bacterium]